MVLRQYLTIALCCLALAQVGLSQTTAAAVSDPQALAIAALANAALTSGTTVRDLNLTGTVEWTAGSDQKSGSVRIKAKDLGHSRIDFAFGNASRTESRTMSGDAPIGQWMDASRQPRETAIHNRLSPAAWFSPATVIASAFAPNAVLTYVGPESVDGRELDHVRSYQTLPTFTKETAQFLQHLTTVDIYLEPDSHLPESIRFNTHPDDDASFDMAVEIRFSDYRVVNGVRVPFRIQKLIEGSLFLDITVQNATVNSGLADSDFEIQ